MGFSGQANEGFSAVLFMGGAEVSRQMRATEFGAFLDGYVGLSDLADSEVRAVYVVMSSDLRIQSLVFFRIYFDEEGRADSHWDLPIEKLAQDGAKGPDLGGGPIRLVCRSQCPVPALADQLWDPDMTPGSNHFQAIRKAVEANTLRFPRKATPEPEEDIPVLSRSVSASDDPEAAVQRGRLAQTIREQRLRIKTLQSVQRDALSELQREHRMEMQAVRNEFAELEQKYERQRVLNEQLKKRLSDRNEQYLSIQEKLSEEADSREQGAHTSDAELVLLREQLERKQRELEMRNGQIQELEEENRELQRREPVEDSLMHQLRTENVFLVAYHAGVGHITLPHRDTERYFDNPVAYAAEKCGVSESAYREWLEHYENPVCHHRQDGGSLCAEPLIRISQPAEFSPGRHDRCEKHQSDVRETA
ncbi:DNA repair protein [Marinobacter sp.]|uniref:DNA repair protein n=1 Tax=Marinobacter sp. TaxID=50741 RepID=UPI00384B3393